MDEIFSIAAKVTLLAYWCVFITEEVSASNPSELQPQTREGLSELVEGGWLITNKPTKQFPTQRWMPTEKMKTEQPGRKLFKNFDETMEFLEEHGLPHKNQQEG